MIDFAARIQTESGGSIEGDFCDIMARQRRCGWLGQCHYNICCGGLPPVFPPNWPTFR